MRDTLLDKIAKSKERLELEKGNSNRMKKEIDAMKSQLTEMETTLTEIKQLLAVEVEKLKNWENRSGKAKEKLKEMLAKYAWIETEKQFFNRPDSIYCFNDLNEHALEAGIKQLEDRRDDLKKRINPSVEALFDMNLKRHEELIRKRQIIF